MTDQKTVAEPSGDPLDPEGGPAVPASSLAAAAHPATPDAASVAGDSYLEPVSYTHLTLPTIYSV